MKKIYSEKDFLNLHKDIKKYLIKKIFIDENIVSSPEFGIGKYKKNGRRKLIRMIIDLKYWNIKIKESIMIEIKN